MLVVVIPRNEGSHWSRGCLLRRHDISSCKNVFKLKLSSRGTRDLLCRGCLLRRHDMSTCKNISNLCCHPEKQGIFFAEDASCVGMTCLRVKTFPIYVVIPRNEGSSMQEDASCVGMTSLRVKTFPI